LVSCSYWPSRNDANNVSGLNGKDYLESPTSDRFSDQLKAIAKFFVTMDLKIAKEAFDCVVKSYAMLAQLIRIEVVLKIRWRELVPLDHHSPSLA
jgi:hypothetical protein